MGALHVNHVLSTSLLDSPILTDLIDRNAAEAPTQTRVTRSSRPSRHADVWHYHRANLERRLLPRAVVTVHHDPRDDRGWMKLKYFLPRYREAQIVHCLNTTQEAVLAKHGISRTCVIPHGVDRRVFPIPRHPRTSHRRSLRLGVLSRRYTAGVKGEFYFRQLLTFLDPHHVSFVFVGAGRWQDAQTAKAMGFAAAHWERVPYRLMAEVLTAIDALLIVSPFEGGPASLPEALGSGVPVLCTPVGMCVDFVRDRENGLLLSGDPDLDTARIMTLLEHDGRMLDRMNCQAFADAATIPTWEHVMAKWHELYAGITSGRLGK